MSISSDSAEQIVRLSLEGVEVVAKISGVAAKNIAVALYAIMHNKEQKQTKGKTTLNKILRTEKELKIFSIKKEDLKTFYQEAKSYGILYCALINRRNRNIDGMVDIMVRAEDAPKVNRIVERYKLSVSDRASIQSQIGREVTAQKEDKDISENAQDIGVEKAGVDEQMIESIFAKPEVMAGQENQNPEIAKTEKSPPSEHSSMSKSNFEGVTNNAKKPSVRNELKKAKQEVDTKLKQAQNSKDTVKDTAIVEIPKDFIKTPIENKERGK